jgi:Sec-independent protein translocase protein TatA
VLLPLVVVVVVAVVVTGGAHKTSSGWRWLGSWLRQRRKRNG